jgi:hypothetical protein
MQVLANTVLALSEMCRLLVLCAVGEVHGFLCSVLLEKCMASCALCCWRSAWLLVLCAVGEVHGFLNLLFLPFFIMKDKAREN